MPYTNSLKVFEKLRPAFDEKQATAVAEAIDEALETNNDVLLDKFDERWDKFEAKIDAKINSLRAELDVKIADLKSEFNVKIADLRADLIKWMFLFWVGQVAVVFAIVKFTK